MIGIEQAIDRPSTLIVLPLVHIVLARTRNIPLQRGNHAPQNRNDLVLTRKFLSQNRNDRTCSENCCIFCDINGI
jgi:hypothetical protein